MPLAAGQILTHYEILAPLGRGGMGEVWRARDTKLEREVAIKVLPEHFADDADRLHRFEREARTLASLNHPHIAGIHGVDQVGDTCFLALELVPGDDLTTRLAAGPLPMDDAVDVCRQIAEGLEAAHEAGVIHRDLKPGNVRVTPDGVVKLLDFGLAKPSGPRADGGGSTSAQPDSVLATEEGVVLGTPTYMSPEQARGRPVDRRTDIWAFGCVLYECLTGERAFGGASFSDVLVAILEREPPEDALPQDTPHALRRLLARCLVKDPRRRLRDIGEARLALEDLAGGGPPSGPVAPVDPRTQRLPRARLVGSLVLLALVCAAGWTWQWLGAGPRAAPNAPLAVSILLPDGLEVSDTIAISPDGSTLAFAAHDGMGDQRVYLRDLDNYALRPVAASVDGTHASFSPDGRSVVFFARDGLYRVSVEGGRPARIAATHAIMGASWGVDDMLVYSTGEGSPLWRVPAQGGLPPEPLTRLEDDPGAYAHTWPQHLPGTRKLIFMTWAGGDQGGPRILDLDTGALRALTGPSEATIAPPVRWSASGHVILENWDDGLSVQAFDPLGTDVVTPGNARQLLEGVANLGDSTHSCFALTRDGTLAYVPSALDRQRLVWVDLDGDTEVVLEDAEIAGSSNLSGNVTLSRDGTRALVGGIDELVEVDLARGLPRRLTHDSSNDTDPQWSADESQAIYESNRGEHWSIWAIDMQEGAEPRLVLRRDQNVNLCDVGPDGAILFTQAGAETRYDVWLQEPGGEARALASTPANEQEASFSPDGAFIAYQSDATGIAEVYVVAAAGGGAPRQVSRGGGRSAKWAPQGTSLYYRRGRAVMRVPMRDGTPDGEASAAFEGPLLLPGRSYDLSPDESRLLAIEIDEDSLLDEIRLVTGYFDAIRSVAGPGSR